MEEWGWPGSWVCEGIWVDRGRGWQAGGDQERRSEGRNVREGWTEWWEGGAGKEGPL